MAFIYLLKDPEIEKKGYVGVSENPRRRFLQHLRSKDICYRANWIRLLKSRGLKPELEILAQVPDSTCKQDEVDYISAFRSLGYVLVNGTNGGEGCSVPKEAAYWFGKILTPEHKKNISAAKAGKKHTSESRANMAASQLGRKHSTETRVKQSASAKLRWQKEKKNYGSLDVGAAG